MKKTIIKAEFRGMNYSLGYKTGKIYTLTIYKPNSLEKFLFYNRGVDLIAGCDGHFNCPYSEAGFGRNWKVLNQGELAEKVGEGIIKIARKYKINELDLLNACEEIINLPKV